MLPFTLFLHFINLKQSPQRSENSCAGGSHDNSCKDHSQHNCDHAGLKIHIQDTGCQSTCPGSCSRKRNPNKDHQCHKKSSTCFFLQLLYSPFSFFQTPGKEFSNYRLICSPYQQFNKKKII